MSRFERLLIAPTRSELSAALTQAAESASRGHRVRTLLPWPPAHTEALVRGLDAAPEGRRLFKGQNEGARPGGKARSVVAACWWTDPLGRRHVRVGGWRAGQRDERANGLLRLGRSRPPLWVVYPEHVYFRREGKALVPFVVCRCGAVGPPEALGWMGPCCAACHDRAEEGSPWRAAGEPASTLLDNNTEQGTSLAFTPDGRSLVLGRLGSMAGGPGVWDLAAGSTRPVDGHPGLVAVSPDGAVMATCLGYEVALVSLKDGTRRRTFQVEPGGYDICWVAFSPDGALLAVACFHRVEVWDLASYTRRAVVREVPWLTSFAPRGVAFSPDSSTLAVSPTQRSPLLLYDVASGASRPLPDLVSELYGGGTVAFSPDGRTLAAITATHKWHVHLLDMAGRALAHLEPPSATDLAISPDGRALAVAGHDASLRLFALDGRPLGEYFWHVGAVAAVAFSPGGRWLATSSEDGTVKLWPVAALLGGGTN